MRDSTTLILVFKQIQAYLENIKIFENNFKQFQSLIDTHSSRRYNNKLNTVTVSNIHTTYLCAYYHFGQSHSVEQLRSY